MYFINNFSKLFYKTSFNNIRYCVTFTQTGEWIHKNNNISTIGITIKSTEELSEIIYIDPLVKIGDTIKENEDMIALESVKATATINSFTGCEIININYNLFENLDILNNEPENIESSWIIKTK